MATQNLSQYRPEEVPSAKGMKVGVVVSEWNSEITFALRDGAVETLLRHGAANDDVIVRYVPGSFELTVGAQLMAGYTTVDAVICLGCVIQGETPHFDYICQGVAFGLTQVSVNFEIPVIFGVLTTLNKEQAHERSGGRLGNKGVEAAVTAIKMANLKLHFQRFEKS
ncbi:MAG: 6,7-dimethyl-8-ribityllumazine synthase [Bacteroidales bacterium]|jgi:6,7-dimethyl-8-ribityllumazine synthase|nr:6,7-dimethyl-8-ribityllumazine synthase [Bacteroidales bacterium]